MTKSLYDPLLDRRSKLEALLLVLESLLGSTPIKYIEKLNEASKETIESILSNVGSIANYNDIDNFLQ